MTPCENKLGTGISKTGPGRVLWDALLLRLLLLGSRFLSSSLLCMSWNWLLSKCPLPGGTCTAYVVTNIVTGGSEPCRWHWIIWIIPGLFGEQGGFAVLCQGRRAGRNGAVGSVCCVAAATCTCLQAECISVGERGTGPANRAAMPPHLELPGMFPGFALWVSAC